MGERTDADWIRTSREVPEAFEWIFDRHYEVVRIYAQRRAGQSHGEEIAAETFERAFSQRHRFDAETYSSARPWLIGIANNLVRRHVRRQEVQRRHWPVSIALDWTEPEPSLDRVDAELRTPSLRTAISLLSDIDRETFMLVVLGELTYAEVAEMLGVPVGTVRSRINRARRHIRELIEAAEAINPGGPDHGARHE